MAERLEPEVLATLRDVLSSETPLARRLALLEPTKKLARMLGGSGASLIETPSSSIGKPHGDLSTHCSREISAAQVTTKGDAHDATPSLSR
jgi:hypothetical protein